MSMERLFPRCFLLCCLLGLTALLAASCAGDSDSSTSENPSTTQSQPAASDTARSSAISTSEDTTTTSLRSTSETPQSTQPEPSENQNTEVRDADISSSSRDSSSLENTAPTNTATVVSTSYEHSCALHEDGKISCWGRNTYGQLGNGQSGDDANSSADSSVPVRVADITDATAVTTGGQHSCALHRGGTISCWGNGDEGQLGNEKRGENVVSSVPVEVAGITDATAVTAGWNHSCALHEDGTISCWGDNTYGALGNGQGTVDWKDDSADSLAPVEVLGITNATAVASNSGHSCALREDGTISCWGNNGSGQLGNRQSRDDGSDSHSSVPVEVADIADATAVTAGQDHSCALHEDGTVSCWGNNYDGQLGNGQSQDYENRSVENRYGTYSWVPTGVAGITDATAISAGREHSCAVHRTGAISCWGNNWHGQLGNGQGGNDEAGFDEIENDTYSPLPVRVVGITDATAVTTGRVHSCAVHRTGVISCWGDTSYGQLGNGQSEYIYDSSMPLEVVGITDATAIATGERHSCALHESGTISCWGRNDDGQLGNGTDTLSSVPVEVVGITDATAITASSSHSCALHQDGTISCWGNNNDGQLGNGTDDESSVPMKVADIADATAITTGTWYSCALHQDGKISCWGNNYEGQLGNGTDDESSVPVEVVGITDATTITAGTWHSCALHQDGTISCWGNNDDGQLGNGANYESSVPVQVVSITDATAITTGGRHSCALHQDGTTSCWGNNYEGQLGNGTDDDSSVPMKVVSIKDATAITTGDSYSCALHQDGTTSCWGRNYEGQLGNGTNNDSSAPVKVADITDAEAVSTGLWHSCALRQGGTISCWGRNNSGQLGNGIDAWSWVPVEVADITDTTGTK